MIDHDNINKIRRLAENYNRLLRQEKYRQTDVVESVFEDFDAALDALQKKGVQIRIIPLELGLCHDNYLVHSILFRDSGSTEWQQVIVDQL